MLPASPRLVGRFGAHTPGFPFGNHGVAAKVDPMAEACTGPDARVATDMDPVSEDCILAHINSIANEGMVADYRPSVDPAACTHPASAPDSGARLDIGGCADEGRAVYFCARRNKASAIGVPLVPGDLTGVVFHEFEFPAHTSDPCVPV